MRREHFDGLRPIDDVRGQAVYRLDINAGPWQDALAEFAEEDEARPRYLDRNYGAILIVWDRLFGTFEPERAPVKYGVLHPVRSTNPFFVGFHLWADILRDLRRPGAWGDRFRRVFAPPDWAEAERARAAPRGGSWRNDESLL